MIYNMTEIDWLKYGPSVEPCERRYLRVMKLSLRAKEKYDLDFMPSASKTEPQHYKQKANPGGFFYEM